MGPIKKPMGLMRTAGMRPRDMLMINSVANIVGRIRLKCCQYILNEHIRMAATISIMMPPDGGTQRMVEDTNQTPAGPGKPRKKPGGVISLVL